MKKKHGATLQGARLYLCPFCSFAPFLPQPVARVLFSLSTHPSGLR